MRELTLREIDFVTGGHCEDSDSDSGSDSQNKVMGVNSEDVGKVIIEVYEGMVAGASHIIERVANAFKD